MYRGVFVSFALVLTTFPRLHRAVAIPAIADVRFGNAANVDLDMAPPW